MYNRVRRCSQKCTQRKTKKKKQATKSNQRKQQSRYVQERPRPSMLNEKCKTGYQRSDGRDASLNRPRIGLKSGKFHLKGEQKSRFIKESIQVTIAIQQVYGLPFWRSLVRLFSRASIFRSSCFLLSLYVWSSCMMAWTLDRTGSFVGEFTFGAAAGT
jgi:hypothetical protein